MKFVEDLSEEELARLQKENEEIREPMPRLSVNRNIWTVRGALQEKAEEIYDKTDRIRIEMTAGNSTFPAFCVIR